MNISAHYDKFLAEHNAFIHSLAHRLRCSDAKAIHNFRAVTHVLRERLSVQQSFHVLSHLPAFLKLYYIEGWKYHNKPIKTDSVDEFRLKVELELEKDGDKAPMTKKSAEEMICVVLSALRKYLDEGTISHIYSELPEPLNHLFGDPLNQ